MEEEEYNDIVIYIQDQKYPQNAETNNVGFTSNTTVRRCVKTVSKIVCNKKEGQVCNTN
jgi:hypothetical protein